MAIAGTVAAVGAVGAYSAHQSNKQAKKAAEIQQKGAEQAQQFSEEAADKASDILRPVAAQGLSYGPKIAPAIERYTALGQQGTQALQAQQGNLNVNQFLDPSMAFAQEEGRKAIEASAAARGGLLSGAALKDIASFSTGLANQNYNNAAQLALQNRQQQTGIANTLTGLGSDALNAQINQYNTGINTVGRQADIQSMQGTNNANLAMTAANAGAASTAAQKDVLGSALSAGIGAFFSDVRLKHNIDEVSDDEIDNFLKHASPKMFDYDEEAVEEGAPRGRQMGVMAQDLEKSEMGREMVEDTDEGKMVSGEQTIGALLAIAANQNKRIKKLEGEK